jgi:hypothetical protein
LFGGKGVSYGESLAGLLNPKLMWGALPLALGSIFYLTRAAQDPAYQRGEKGYLRSVGSTISGAGRETRRRMGEAAERYGQLGALPVHAMNLILDPVGALSAAGTKATDVLLGKQGELLDQAEAAVDRALRDG